MKNSMKALFSTIVVAAVMSSPIFAEKGYAHGDENQSMGGSMMMGMMSREQMAEMSEHMQKMLKIMDKIKGETDPEKRQQLMQEHMQAMQEGMQMMNKGMPMQDSMKMTEHQGKGMSDKMGEPDMMKRMDMMEERMGMMQMMMGQMMEHESEAKY
ncbi:hypothetical protein NB466_09530 [Vibrio fluvialis]|uniref:hypothetical protein n=1 Tax=Vibrio fluvialis TaxID=676 RepID=UPI00215CB326|nr:hypothetical protein [Vibrio fluvialis]MCR9299119.1 hypothetical protein [Vibrio fluvialis]